MNAKTGTVYFNRSPKDVGRSDHYAFVVPFGNPIVYEPAL